MKLALITYGNDSCRLVIGDKTIAKGFGPEGVDTLRKLYPDIPVFNGACIPYEEKLTITVDSKAAYEALQEITNCSNVTRALLEQLIDRDAHGKAKYGVTLDRTDLNLGDWLQHQAEELMDGAGYALAAKREYERLRRIEEAALAYARGPTMENIHRLHEVLEQ